jgi:hypothetical protein
VVATAKQPESRANCGKKSHRLLPQNGLMPAERQKSYYHRQDDYATPSGISFHFNRFHFIRQFLGKAGVWRERNAICDTPASL